MEELKPCPFCGGRADLEITSLFKGDTSLVVSCTGCGCELLAKHNATEQEAIAAWNQRATSEQDECNMKRLVQIGEAVVKNKPIRFLAGETYVPERTCELKEPHSYQPMNLMTCSSCGMKTAVANFCSWCGAKVR